MSSYSETMADRDIVAREKYEEENQLREFFKFLREYFEVEQKWDEVQQFGVEHPVTSLFLIVAMAMCSIPVVMFTIFIIGSLAFSITGFLFFEGTVIAVASFVLGGVLLFVGMFAVGVSIFLLVGYHIVVLAGQLLGKVTGNVPALPFGGDRTVTKVEAKKD